MICRGEVTDDDLKRLGANTIGDRLNIKRISREASRMFMIKLFRLIHKTKINLREHLLDIFQVYDMAVLGYQGEGNEGGKGVGGRAFKHPR